MSRLGLFLLLSLALHLAAWLLHGAVQPPMLSAVHTSTAPQVLRLAAVLQHAAPAAAKPPEHPPQAVAVPSKIPAPTSVTTRPVTQPRPVQKRPAAPPQSTPARPAAPMSRAAQAAVTTSVAPAQAFSTQPAAEVLSSKPSFRQPPPQPSYPAQARRRNQQGVVLVEVRLDAHGRQHSLNVLRSSGVDSLDRAALEAVAQWHFHPETSGGQAVPSRVQIPIQFALTANR